MSSQIFYERIFIKLPEDRYIPLFLNGSSNTWEGVGCHERRERNWWEFRPKSAIDNGQYILTRSQIEELAKEARGWPYSGMCLKHMGRKLDDEQAERYILGGLKTAVLVEDAIACGNCLFAHLVEWDGLRQRDQIYLGRITTTGELLSLFEAHPNEKIRLSFSTYSPFHKPKAITKISELIDAQGFAFVLRRKDYYVQSVRHSKRGQRLFLTERGPAARQFATEKAAADFKSRYNSLIEYTIAKIALPEFALCSLAADVV